MKQLEYKGPWCCEQGQAQGVPVCDECAEISAGYQAAMSSDAQKCDDNHGGPRCTDQECWNDAPTVKVSLSVAPTTLAPVR